MKQNREPFLTEHDREELRSTVTPFVPRSKKGIADGQSGVILTHPIDTAAEDCDDPGPSAA